MIRSIYLAARDRRRNRVYRRHGAVLLDQERANLVTEAERVEAMAIQLAEIRSLPERDREG